MTDATTTPDDVAPQVSLVNLLRSDAPYDSDVPRPPGWKSGDQATDLRAVAAAPLDVISNSARIDLLYRLARKNYPGRGGPEDAYVALADTIVRGKDVDGTQLLNDLLDAAQKRTPLRETPSGRQFDPGELAFIEEEESVCQVRKVKVGDLTGTWIYSTFETDAPFDAVARWVDPRGWPHLAPMMFKKMEVAGWNLPLDLAGLGPQHWHGVFHEEVQLVARINTLLHCDHWRDDDQNAAGMTFDLSFSSDGQLDIDRGFIAVNEVQNNGKTACRVQALKIVGFTDNFWDDVADWVCPFWTDFLRGAVEASTSPPVPKQGGPDTAPAGTPSADDVTQAWLKFFGASAEPYLHLFEDVNERTSTGQYTPAAFLADGSRFWSLLARDWVRAWNYGLGVARELPGDDGEPPTMMPPKVPQEAPARTGGSSARAAARGSTAPVSAAGSSAPGTERFDEVTVSVPALQPSDDPVCTELSSIEGRPPTIAGDSVSVTVEEPAGGRQDIRLKVLGASAPPGLYVGHVLNKREGDPLASVQFYFSGATGA